jgi:hypothetical protein
MASKRTYVAVAAKLKDTYLTLDDPSAVAAVAGLAEDLAAIFAEENPRFDRVKFLLASGLPESQVRPPR